MESLIRYDAGEVISLSEDPETGFLKGTARVTRIGVFDYLNADGSIKRELRHPHEVFSKKSLDSMAMIPITNDHPKTKMVNSETAKALSIGFTGENVHVDGQFVVVPINITDAAGIAAVKAGRRELSLGYMVTLENKAGNFDGSDYDCVQKDIQYNHLAIVDKARAGSACAIKIDGSDAVQIEKQIINPLQEENMVKVKLDSGLEYDAAPEVAQALAKAAEQIKAFELKADAAIKAADEARAKADSATAELAKLSARDIDGEIKAAAKIRGNLERTAATILDAETVAKLDSMSDAEIKTAVILKQFPEAKLDGVSADYLSARYDSAVELLGKAAAAGASQRQKTADSTQEPKTDSRAAYLERLENGWKEQPKK